MVEEKLTNIDSAKILNVQALQLINVTKKFLQGQGEIMALNKVNLEIKKGEMVALTGASGSGKTTLLQIAGLLDKFDSGQIIINGVDMTNASDNIRTNFRKNNLGFIYQFHHLLPEFTAVENVALPLLIQGKSKLEAISLASDLLKEIGLGHRLNQMATELSGGEQQRVAVARAIISKPALILADEPTGNLDSQNSEKIFDLLQKLVNINQIACLFVTHNLELAKKVEKNVIIKDGNIF